MATICSPQRFTLLNRELNSRLSRFEDNRLQPLLRCYLQFNRARSTRRGNFFICRETAANKKHQPYRAKTTTFSPRGQVVFAHRRLPMGKKRQNPLCPLWLCGEPILLKIRHRNYELEHLGKKGIAKKEILLPTESLSKANSYFFQYSGTKRMMIV